MFRLLYIPIVLLIANCTVESTKCTKEDILQLTGAGFSKNEISEICNSNGIYDEDAHTTNITESGEKATPPLTNKPIEIEPDSVSTNESTGSDMESKANKLYVQASNQVQKIKAGAGSYAKTLELYQSARNKIEYIISDYDASTIAVDLISDQMKIAGLTWSKFERLESTLQTLAEAEQDLLACARLVAGKIEHKATVLSEIAELYASLGRFDEALLTANTIEHDYSYTKVGALVDIADKYAEIGQRENANQILSQAYKIVNSINGKKRYRLSEIAAKYAEIGQFSKALETAMSIKFTFSKAEVLAKIAVKLARSGQQQKANQIFIQAMEIAETIKDTKHDPSRAESFTVIAEKHIEIEQFSQALSLVERIDNSCQQYKALEKLALKFAEVGRFASALETAGKIEDTYGCFSFPSHTFGKIAHKYAEAGRYDEAINVVRSIDNKSWAKAKALVEIAGEYIESGNQEIADQLLLQALETNGVIEAHMRPGMISGIAIKYAEIGQYGEALKLANTINNNSQYKDRVLEKLAQEYADAGRFSEGIKLVKLINKVVMKNRALSDIALNFAEAGRFKDALETAGRIENTNKKYETQAVIAEKYAEVGQLTQALMVVNAINNKSEEKARALAKIAVQYADVGKQRNEKEIALLHDIVKAAKPMKLPWE